MSTPRRLVAATLIWAVAGIAGVAVVVYGLGPLLQNRAQQDLLDDFRGHIDRAVGQSQSLFGPEDPTTPVEIGEPVAILEIPALRLQQVVVEGVSPDETADGPGHVPGTPGLGQPGDSAVVGRRLGYGAPFRDLERLRPGDDIVVATTQGRSLYRVTEVSRQEMDEDRLYALSPANELTLVTTGSRRPWTTDHAIVVSARLEGLPFEPTPQHGRTDAQDGRSPAASAWPLLLLSGGLFVAAAAGASLLYRRWRPLATYLITAPALLALVVLTAESLSRAFPAWL